MPTSMSAADMAANQSNVPAFLSKLWRLVEDDKYDSLISWSTSGQSFIIHDQTQFAKDVLPLFFKHNNMASFIRQLNMYGFRKMVNVDSGGLRGGKEDVEFYHNYFSRGQEAMLEYIKRKAPTHQRGSNPPMVGSPNQPTNGDHEMRNELVRELLTDVNQLQGKQERVDSQLDNMKRENEALWREVAILRRQHLKQQQVVEKLIRFLATLVHGVQGNDKNIGMKRKRTLMIDEGGKFRKLFKGHMPVRQVTGLKNLQTNGRQLENGPIISDITYDGNDRQQATAINQRLAVQNTQMPFQEKSPVVSSPNSGSAMCPTDDFVLCENLFDEDVLPPQSDEDEINLGKISTKGRTAEKELDYMSSALNTPQIDIWDEAGTSSKNGLEVALQGNNGSTVDHSSSKNEDQSVLSSTLGSSHYQSKGTMVPEDHSMRSIYNPPAPMINTRKIQTEHFNDHIEGTATELDWLQDQMANNGLNIDPNSFMELFNTEDTIIPNFDDCIQQDDENDDSNARKLMALENRVF